MSSENNHCAAIIYERFTYLAPTAIYADISPIRFMACIIGDDASPRRMRRMQAGAIVIYHAVAKRFAWRRDYYR